MFFLFFGNPIRGSEWIIYHLVPVLEKSESECEIGSEYARMNLGSLEKALILDLNNVRYLWYQAYYLADKGDFVNTLRIYRNI